MRKVVMTWIRAALRGLLPLILLIGPLKAAEPDPATADEAALNGAGLGTDDAALVQFFRSQTLTKERRAHVAGLVQRLGDASFRAREQATEEIVRLGSLAVPLLRDALKNPDLEIARRAERCLERIDSGPSAELANAAARLVTVRKPTGAPGVLLAYLSDAPDDGVADRVRAALAAVAVRHGLADPAVVRALGDRSPIRRAAAGEALCQAGATRERPAVRKLLADPDTLVRLRVALALARAGDRKGVPVLVALLGELPPEHVWRAEDALLQLAGDQAPNVVLGTEAEERRKARDAWQAWWHKHGDRVDLARLGEAPALLGLTLIAHWDNGQVGHIAELGPDGKARRDVQNIPWPIDFYWLPGNRLLCAEYYINKVTERNFKGEQLWEKTLPENPLAAQRLANGNTFIVMRSRLLEVDRTGKEVNGFAEAGRDIVSAIKTRNGQVYLVTQSGQFRRLDATGKEVKSFPVGGIHSYAAIDVMPNGHVVVPHYDRNKVIEYDTNGKTVWEATVQQPTAPVRLPNGHTLVACRDAQTVVELDRSGKAVWTYKATTYPWRVRRR
jgi:HEAT repeat protein